MLSSAVPGEEGGVAVTQVLEDGDAPRLRRLVRRGVVHLWRGPPSTSEESEYASGCADCFLQPLASMGKE